MVEPFLGEIRRVSFNFAPRNWALCDGQLLPINANQALFSLLGTTYGGNGVTNFALPDLRGRHPLHPGGGITVGQSGGEEAHTLAMNEMPAHTHQPFAASGTATATDPSGAVWAATTQPGYAASGGATMHPSTIAEAGGSQPHENRPPFLAVNFIIAMAGVFPPRD
jgi:microcystin-dependent protein